jgi:hypothetical protein
MLDLLVSMPFPHFCFPAAFAGVPVRVLFFIFYNGTGFYSRETQGGVSAFFGKAIEMTAFEGSSAKQSSLRGAQRRSNPYCMWILDCFASLAMTFCGNSRSIGTDVTQVRVAVFLPSAWPAQ